MSISKDPQQGAQGDPRTDLPPSNDGLPPNPIPESCLLVGLGASAGGVQALRKFMANVRADSGMAYMVVLHLAPEHESSLPQILQSVTEIPVVSVTDPTPIRPNHVYVIPPNKHLAITDGYLHLMEVTKARGRLIPIDLFFRSLAETYPAQSAGIVLSGTGSDGTQGLKRLKEAGAITVAQDPADAEHPEMPRSALDSRMVDCVLLAAQMPDRLRTLWHTALQIRLPQHDEPEHVALPISPDEESAAAVRDLLALVRVRTGNDFSQYKRATILRRIARRMTVQQIQTLPEYVAYVREFPAEVHALTRDFMISVTEFFRDPEAFETLEEQIIPRLFKDKGVRDQVRAWVPACATGEEAYSLAILLMEHASSLEFPPQIQVFASDIDATAVEIAREGVYEETIAADMTPERLRRFFVRDGRQYRVRKEVRECVLFSNHNALSDPPFSRQDLISCRNLLIYLNQELQERLLEVFHFALLPEGYLFLGSSETAEEGMGLFAPVDKRFRIYSRRPGSRPTLPLLGAGGMLSGVAHRGHPGGVAVSGQQPSITDVHLRVLEQAAPPNLLVNENYDILRVGEGASRFLRYASGEPTHNLLQVIHPDLRLELRTALYSASQQHARELRQTQVTLDNKPVSVRITVQPVTQPELARGYFLVLLEEVLPELAGGSARRASRTQPLARQLEGELQRVKAEMRSVVEQYESANEELRASNEELHAINEELRSATEEVETSKEELQSLNEELTTVNQELKARVEEVSRSNTDLQNLMASTDIGTIFLDRNLRIKRYTPAAQRIFNVIPSDEGRPLSDITFLLDYPLLTEDALQVLERLAMVEREVASTDGRWYLVRHTPYRTAEDRIAGVVVTFLDITERKAAVQALEESEERFRLLVEGSPDYAMFLLDPERRVVYWNSGAERVLGYRRDEVLGRSGDLIYTTEDQQAGVPEQEARTAAVAGRADDRRWHQRKDGSRFWADGVMTGLFHPDGTLRGFAKVFRDATAEQRAQAGLEQAHHELERRVRDRTAEVEQANAARQRLIQQLVTAEEAERRRISRELHDQTGQQLTALILELRALWDQMEANPEARTQLERLRELANEVGQEIHYLAFELRPTSLDDLGLRRALENYVDQWSARTGIALDYHASGLDDQRESPEIETALYRIVQEALHNVARHAQSPRVSVILERRDQSVQAIVEDEGRGFDVDAVLSGSNSGQRLGLAGMRERAALLGGEVTIESAPGRGTTVFVRMPLKTAGADDTPESGEAS